MVTCASCVILYKHTAIFCVWTRRECCKIILWKTKFSIISTCEGKAIMKNYMELKYYTCSMYTHRQRTVMAIIIMTMMMMMMRSITCSQNWNAVTSLQCRSTIFVIEHLCKEVNISIVIHFSIFRSDEITKISSTLHTSNQ